MIPLFFISMFLSKKISILSENINPTTYFFSKKYSMDIHLSNEFLFSLFFFLFFQSLYFRFQTFKNTILFYIYMDIHSLPFYYDSVILKTKIEKEYFFFTRRNILFINYIFLSFLLSKIELGTLFFLLFLHYYGNIFFEKINTNYSINNFYELYVNSSKQYFINFKKIYNEMKKNYLNYISHDLPEKNIDDIYFNTKYHGSPRNWSWDPILNTLTITGSKKNYSHYNFTIHKPFDISEDKITIHKSNLEKNSYGNFPSVSIQYISHDLPEKNIDDIYFNTKYHGSPRNWSWDPILNTLTITGSKKNYSHYNFTIHKPFDISEDKITIHKSNLEKNSYGNFPSVSIQYISHDLPEKN